MSKENKSYILLLIIITIALSGMAIGVSLATIALGGD